MAKPTPPTTLALTRVIPADAFGPNTADVVTLVNALPTLTDKEWQRAIDAAEGAKAKPPAPPAGVSAKAWEAAWLAAWDASVDDMRVAVSEVGIASDRADMRAAANDAVRQAAWASCPDGCPAVVFDAVAAVVLRDLLDVETFDALTAPMRAAGVKF